MAGRCVASQCFAESLQVSFLVRVCGRSARRCGFRSVAHAQALLIAHKAAPLFRCWLLLLLLLLLWLCSGFGLAFSI